MGSLRLPFFGQIVTETHAADSLHVVARGLGMHNAASAFLASAVKPGMLILLLNVPRQLATTVLWPTIHDALPFRHSFSSSGVASSPNTATNSTTQAGLLLPRFLNADYNARDRIAVYTAGGLVSVTATVLVHDLLQCTLPCDRVYGVVVYNADQVKERSNIHFAMSLFRTRNRTAFIKAFSENPVGLAAGFHTAEKLMRLLYVSRLVLWPRFHRSIREDLRAHQPDLVDLVVTPTSAVAALRSALKQTASSILTDLKYIVKTIDLSDMYQSETSADAHKLPNAIARPSSKTLIANFDDAARRNVENAAGDSFSPRVRALLTDLTVLRTLLRNALHLNAVQFYQSVVTLRHAADRSQSWLVRKEAQPAIQLARSRVWSSRTRRITSRLSARPFARAEKDASTVSDVANGHSNRAGNPPGESISETETETVSTLEPSPKWHVLIEVLKEIRADVHAAGAESDVGRVLIAVHGAHVVDELTAVLSVGEKAFLYGEFRTVFPAAFHRAKHSETEDGEDKSFQTTLTQLAAGCPETTTHGIGHTGNNVKFNSARSVSGRPRRGKRGRETATSSEERARFELDQVFREVTSRSSTDLNVMVKHMEWVDIQGRALRLMEDYRPSFIILYNADLALIRQVEVFKAALPGRPVRLYVLSFDDDGGEEERFRKASDREKTSFKTLIRERATMTVHADQEGRRAEEVYSQMVLEGAAGSSGTSIAKRGRQGLGSDHDSRLSNPCNSQNPSARNVIVDTRELRSSLPMLLHQAELMILPMTLEVADFVLSPDIGVERKSLQDLHGSFGSGRLFNQADALCRYYKVPCLLIELDSNRPLSLTASSGGVPSELHATSIVSKMVLLIQQFPLLRLLWAKGASDAAELFVKLKHHEKEPNVAKAVALGVDAKEVENEDLFNASPKALLRSLPGIDSQNLQRVMRKVRNVATLVTMSGEEMTDVLGSAARAAKLFAFVNEKPSEALAAL